MKKKTYGWLVLLILSLGLTFSGCFRMGCSSDPDQYLLFDTLTLIDDYYIERIDKKVLMEEGFRGMALELALRKIEKEREQAKAWAEKEAGAQTPSDSNLETQKEQKDDEPIPTDEPDKEAKDKEDQELANDLIRGEIDELLKRAPFSVIKNEQDITLEVSGKVLHVPYPVEKEELIEGFFRGQRFLQSELQLDPADKELMYSGINGMVHSLDPHSSFLPPKICNQLKAETSGSFAGVGIEIGTRRNLLTVIQPIVGSPAHRAGLKARDIISAIDGTSSLGMSLMEAVELIRGEVGTEVTLTVMREGVEEPFDKTLVREKIDETSVKTEMLDGRIGYIRLHKFNEKTINDLDAGLAELTKDSGKLRGLILDLRYNPGGLLDQAVEVADKFLDSGMIVNTMGRGMFVDKRRFATGKNTDKRLPLLVMLNLHSASGAEIVAGALQDHERALLIGTRSFGKGSVQSIFRLPADACLRLTTALYYTPSGRSIQATGIVPDIAFVYPEEEEELLAAYSEKALKNHLVTSKADGMTKAKATFEVERIFEYYKEKNLISVDQDFPEKSDWMMVLAKQIMSGDDLAQEGMLKRGIDLLSQIPQVEPKVIDNVAQAPSLDDLKAEDSATVQP